MDQIEIDKLLTLAKQNLQKTQNDEPEKDSGLSEIRESWQRLPKLEPGIQVDTTTKVAFATNAAGSSIKTSEVKFRKIEDPVQVALEKKAAKEKTSGKDWFDMPKTELTPELKRDLQLLKMRHVWDPKRHYKKDNSPLPTYFQTGTIIEGNTEFFSARIARKDRKKTITQELLADQDAYSYFKRKHGEVQQAGKSGKHDYNKLKRKRQKK